MAKKAAAPDIHDPESVNAYIKKLDPATAQVVEAVREMILGSGKEIGERIKWNSPSFFYTGSMKPFDPKEYKRDIAVFNLRPGRMMLVLPTGAQVKHDVLEGSYTDGRRMITIKDLADAKAKKKALQQVVKEWVKLVDK